MRAIILIVKGTATEAVMAALKHGMKAARVHKENPDNTILHALGEPADAAQWFTEDYMEKWKPFPPGSLLYYR